MRLFVLSEMRFVAAEGAVWTPNAQGYDLWRSYLEVFDSVTVIARVDTAELAPAGWLRADGESVTFYEMPYYLGFAAFVRRLPALRRAARALTHQQGAFLIRAPSILATLFLPALRRAKRPFGLQVVGDPYEVFAAGSLRHPLRPLLRLWFTCALQKQCQQAAVIAYVPSSALLRRYPPRAGAPVARYSDVTLPDHAYASAPRRWEQSSPLRLITVASLAQPYKGVDLLIKALAHCRDQGLPLHLDVVGDGRYRADLEQLARSLQVQDQVDFHGALAAGKPIRDRLDAADLFVLASRTEGLPRALIEAMARGLPCIGARVGGIPDLLEDSMMFAPGDALALAVLLQHWAAQPARMAECAGRNLARSRDFHIDLMRASARNFYLNLRQHTEAWQAER